MRMNRTETVLVNSPPRRWLQRAVETPVLLRLGGRLAGGTALELGCGQGAGIELILDRFGADRVIGFDLDEAMVARARRRLAGRSDVDVRVGDAVAIDLPDASVDAVFDFAIIHHVPDWQTAVGEIRRVLRPGGRLYYSEVTKHALDRPTYRMLFDHPDHDRFTASDFVAALEDHDLRVGDRHRTLIAGDYALGVAERMPHSPS